MPRKPKLSPIQKMNRKIEVTLAKSGYSPVGDLVLVGSRNSQPISHQMEAPIHSTFDIAYVGHELYKHPSSVMLLALIRIENLKTTCYLDITKFDTETHRRSRQNPVSIITGVAKLSGEQPAVQTYAVRLTPSSFFEAKGSVCVFHADVMFRVNLYPEYRFVKRSSKVDFIVEYVSQTKPT